MNFNGSDDRRRVILSDEIEGRALKIAIQSSVVFGARQVVLDRIVAYGEDPRSHRHREGGAVTRRLAAVDLRRDQYIVSAFSKTEAGFWIGEGDPVVVPGSADPGTLG